MATVTDQMNELRGAEEELKTLKKRVAELRRLSADETVENYPFQTPAGTRDLSSLFGDKDDLILIHNMGKQCALCTLWADGLNGVLPHLQNRAAFALASPDDPKTQQEFAAGRGWDFTIVSTKGSSFTNDMGYESETGGQLPGVSTFRKDASGKITRVGTAPFGPGDEFCGVWHLLDLLHDGANGWGPKFSY